MSMPPGAEPLPRTSDPPTISVVIPTRNRLPLLRQAVASVVRQTDNGWECLVIDDDSEDGTADWIRSGGDLRVKLTVLSARGGRSHARNQGLFQAQGRAVVFLDDDDLLAPGAVAAFARGLVASPGAVAVVGGRVTLRSDGTPGRPVRMTTRPEDRLLWPEIMFGWCPLQGQAAIRTEALTGLGGWNEGLSDSEDRELWVRLTHDTTVAMLREVVVAHRTTGAPLEGDPAHAEMAVSDFLDTLSPESRSAGRRFIAARRRLVPALKAQSSRRFATASMLWLRAAMSVPTLAVGRRTRGFFLPGLGRSLVGAAVGVRGYERLRELRRRRGDRGGF